MSAIDPDVSTVEAREARNAAARERAMVERYKRIFGWSSLGAVAVAISGSILLEASTERTIVCVGSVFECTATHTDPLGVLGSFVLVAGCIGFVACVRWWLRARGVLEQR